ncbi:MAG: hypothetical protein SGARI_001249 [Bacillariaceae sp.]
MHVFKNTRMQGVFEKGFSSEGNFVLALVWGITGLLAFLIPLIHRTIHKNKYEEVYMSYYWEQEYEWEEEQRKEGYEQYGNNYNYGGAYMYPQEWAEHGEPMPEQGWYPSWFSGWAVTEEDREMMESGHMQPAGLKFAYVWQLIIFIGIIWYGIRVIRQQRNPTGLLIALFIWTNYAFMSMWLMADGSIQTDGQGIKRTGFYGQVSTLIFTSNFWYFLHGLAFCVVFGIRKCMIDDEERKLKKEQAKNEKISEAEQEKSYQAPTSSQQQSS